MAQALTPLRDPEAMLAQAMAEWGGRSDLWVFGYASLIWRPEFVLDEHRLGLVHGYHRALKMWSRINRGTPECPGLVFAMLSGGSCQGVTFRIPRREAAEVLSRLWAREMMTGVYDPRWLNCRTAKGHVRSLAFTLSRRSPSYTGALSDQRYREILSVSCGRFGTTLDYAQKTWEKLLELGIRDHELERVLKLSGC